MSTAYTHGGSIGANLVHTTFCWQSWKHPTRFVTSSGHESVSHFADSSAFSRELDTRACEPAQHLLKVLLLVIVDLIVVVVGVVHADGGALRDGALLGRGAPARVGAGQLAADDLRLLVDAQTLHALLLRRLLDVPVVDGADD